MKVNFIAYFILILIALQSCSSGNINTPEINTTHIENDSLAKSWAQNLFNFRNSMITFKTELLAEKNPFIENQIDSLKILRYKKSRVRFLVIPKRSFDPFQRIVLMDALLYDPELELSFGLKIKSSRQELEKSLNLKLHGDTIVIHGKKSDMKFVLLFSTDSLRAVEYSGTLSY